LAINSKNKEATVEKQVSQRKNACRVINLSRKFVHSSYTLRYFFENENGDFELRKNGIFAVTLLYLFVRCSSDKPFVRLT